MSMHFSASRIALLLFLVLTPTLLPASPTTLTYQGQLQEAGTPHDGIVDLTFRLYDAESEGNKIGPTIERTDVNVDDGLFQVELDFGAVYGGPRWLEIEVDGSQLLPRQRLTHVPAAIRSGTTQGFAPGEPCDTYEDCASRACSNGVCQAPTCSDGWRNGEETGVDCGGPDCSPCVANKGCEGDGDCQSGVCRSRTCQAATCSDGATNGQETAADCGGPDCVPCDTGRSCLAGSDCESGVCQNGTCAAPGCIDGVQNGTESDVDCGGLVCSRCAAGEACNVDTDCESDSCLSGSCASP